MEQLNSEQQKAINTTKGPVLILAGAGSGKTKVLTHRIAHLLNQNVSPERILAITFTNKAASEMRSRVDRLAGEAASSVWLYTFHAFCAKFLRQEIDILEGYHKNFTIYDADDSKNIIKSIQKDWNIDPLEFQPTFIQNRISDAKNRLIWPDQYKNLESGNPYLATIADIYAEYLKRMKENNAVDFDDLILLTLKILTQNDWCREKYQDSFEYIMVDEYQDVNKVQYLLTKLLAAKHRNLCVVGDADQSIYSWRGADISNILSFEKDYPDAITIKLEQNYRSTKEILDAANAVIKNNVERKEKKLWTDHKGNKIFYYNSQNEITEAKFITNMIKNLVTRQNIKFSEIAILYRANIQSKPLEQELLNSGINYQIIGGLKLNERKEIKDILAYLSVIVNPYDSMHLSRIINVPKRGIGNSTISKLQSFSELHDIKLFDIISSCNDYDDLKLSSKIKEKLEELSILIYDMIGKSVGSPIKEILVELLDRSGYIKELTDSKKPDNKDRIEHISELLKIAEEYDKSVSEPSIENFLQETALVTASDELDGSNSVTLMTLHSAKGLEYPIVFLTGMNEGIFPSLNSLDKPFEIEEERRLCYVGITRAKQLLCLTGANERTIYGKTNIYSPSRFIEEIPKDNMQVIAV